jgi:uncharacterized GH25 family protein
MKAEFTIKWIAFTFALLAPLHSARAHDTWLETNTNLVRVGDAVHVDLMLGNHGNDHRDLKLAGKVDPSTCTLEVIGPDGKATDIKDRLVDRGAGPKEGFWSAIYTAAAPGTHLVAQASDAVVKYAPKRSIKSAKAIFVASTSLDRPPVENPGFDRALGHALEIVPTRNPVTPMGPGTPIVVKVFLKGQPLADARVSFIPRGVTLKEGFDERYERKTDERGEANFEPDEANSHLIVVHHETHEKGVGYETASYSATLTVFVPALPRRR